MLLEIVLVLVALIYIIDLAVRNYKTRKLKNVSLVSKIPIIGTVLKLSSITPDNFYIKWPEFLNHYGKSLAGIALGSLIMVTVDHRIVEAVLASQEHLSKHNLYLLLSPWLGKGLLLSTGKPWFTMRKIITPTFHFKILEQFVEVFDRQADVFIEKLKAKADGCTAINISEYMSLLTLDIIAETSMGVRINAQINSESKFAKAVHEVTNILSYRFIRLYLTLSPIFRLLRPKMYEQQQEGIKVMHDFTERIIAERQESLLRTQRLEHDPLDLGIKPRMALLDVLLQGSINGQPLTDKQIRDEVNTFMFEGHDTTSAATSFCLYAISRNSRVQQKLFKELHDYFGNDLQRPLSYNDLQQLNYLNCVIKESLRMYPPVLAIGRRLESDLKIGNISIPSKTDIIILLWEMLRDPAVFEDPLNFLPERHLANNARVNAFSNIPFSAGPRNCIGQKFALLEMRAIIIKVIRNFELLPLGSEIQPSMHIVLRSTTGINLGLKLRQSG